MCQGIVLSSVAADMRDEIERLRNRERRFRRALEEVVENPEGFVHAQGVARAVLSLHPPTDA